MENVINSNPTREIAILELASMIARRTYYENANVQPSVGFEDNGEIVVKRDGLGGSTYFKTSSELEDSIRAILAYMYNDELKSYEEMKEDGTDEQMLSYHIFRKIDYVAKILFPQQDDLLGNIDEVDKEGRKEQKIDWMPDEGYMD